MFSNLTIKKGDAYAFPNFVFMKRRNLAIFLVCFLLAGTFLGCGNQASVNSDGSIQDEKNVETPKEDLASDSSEKETIEEVDNVEDTVEAVPSFLDRMGRGINIGNALDCFNEWDDSSYASETSWGNPEISEEYVKMLVDSGFKTIRIPVSWSPHIQDGKIDEAFMSRVRQVVDYGYNLGANVIIDIHHDRRFSPSNGNYEASREYLVNVWSQVAEEFKDYDERLIFEGINEPRFYGTGDEWTEGTQEGSDNVNRLMLEFVSAVRSTGGNNETRLLLITCYCNRAGGGALNRMVFPADDNIAVSVHSYDPYDFTSSDSQREFDDGLKQQYDYTVNTLKDFKNKYHVPVIITEWGTYESVGKTGRIEYINYVLKSLDEADIPCVWWDNGKGYGHEGYALYERYSKTAIDQDVIDALLKEN